MRLFGNLSLFRRARPREEPWRWGAECLAANSQRIRRLISRARTTSTSRVSPGILLCKCLFLHPIVRFGCVKNCFLLRFRFPSKQISLSLHLTYVQWLLLLLLLLWVSSSSFSPSLSLSRSMNAPRVHPSNLESTPSFQARREPERSLESEP